jgi:hypothetical protein
MMASDRFVQKNRLDVACESALQKLLNAGHENMKGVYTLTVDSIPVRATIMQRGLMYEIDIVSSGRHDISRVIDYSPRIFSYRHADRGSLYSSYNLINENGCTYKKELLLRIHDRLPDHKR